jgi:hypothetical protein
MASKILTKRGKRKKEEGINKANKELMPKRYFLINQKKPPRAIVN